MLCPECNTDLAGGVERCHICGNTTASDLSKWVEIGSFENRLMADLACETLKSTGIPAIVNSRDGFFGDAGLVFNPFFKAGRARYTIAVAAAQTSEASETLTMTLGEEFHRGDD